MLFSNFELSKIKKYKNVFLTNLLIKRLRLVIKVIFYTMIPNKDT